MGDSGIKNVFTERYSQLVIQHPWLIVTACLLLFSLGAAGLPHAGFNSSYRVFFGKDDPHLQAFKEFEAIYANEDNIAVVLHHPQKPVFSNEVLQSVRDLTDALWKTSYITRVDSVTNFQHTEVVEDDFIVRDLIPPLPLTEAELRKKERIALNEPLAKGPLLSPDGSVTRINAKVLLPLQDQNPMGPSDLYAAVDQLIQWEREKHSDITYRISGAVAMIHAFSTVPRDDLRSMIPLMLGFTAVLMTVLVRSTWGVLLPLTVVLLSIVFTLGLSGHLGIQLTVISSTFPLILFAVVIAYSIHVVMGYTRSRRAGLNREASVEATIRKNLTPIFLSALTSSAGFLSLTLNEIPPIRDLGILVGSGVLFTFLMTVAFLPASLALCPCGIKFTTPLDTQHGGESYSDWTVWLGHIVTQKHTWLYYILLGLAVAGSLFIYRLELDNNPINYFKPGNWYRQSAEFVDAELGGSSYTEFSFDTGRSYGITNPTFLEQVEAFTEYLLTIPEVTHVNSIVPIMKRLNKNLHADDPSFYRVPDNQELAAQYLLLYTMSLPFGLDLTTRINVDYSSTRVTATLKKISAKRHLEILTQIEAWAAQHIPGLSVQGVGPWVMFSHQTERVIRELLKSLVLALMVISIACGLAFRSLRLGILSLMPNGLPILLTFGLWGIIGEYVDIGVSIVASAALGVIVDDTIHLLFGYRRAKERGIDKALAFRSALKEVGHELLLTTMILVVGFGLFLLSDFRMNATFGVMISSSLAIALVYDFLFLPGMLMRFDR